MTIIRHLADADCGGAEELGGKGWNLHVLLRAGLPVPPAFCLTSEAHRAARSCCNGSDVTLDAALESALTSAYDQLGQGVVAVRSSATVEDGAFSSFAGLQETILGVEGRAALAAAVERCWRSIDSERARVYRARERVDESRVAMAVVVQRLVEAEVSGVMFTHDPMDATGQSLLVEAAWGLGEAIVSGLVTPDRYHLDRETSAVISQHIAVKHLRITSAGEQPIPAELQQQPCLNEAQLRALAELAGQIEKVYGGPRDVEWAWAEGRLWLLQARPITAATAFEREQARTAEVARLAALAEPRGTVWARYNLAEVLPTPTPLTWAIVRRFMSGRGGLGMMFRDFGFEPDPALDDVGYIDLICGQPFVNLSREAKMHFSGFPYGHAFSDLKQHPERALYPQPTPDSSQVTARFLLRLPVYIWKMLRANRRVQQLAGITVQRLREEVFPKFLSEVRGAEEDDLGKLSNADLLARFQHWEQRTLHDFARDSLKPATLAARSMGLLEQQLTPALGADRAGAEVRRLLTGAHPDADADLPGALRRLAEGALSREAFLADFGHRGSHEMELAELRWRERPDSLPSADLLSKADSKTLSPRGRGQGEGAVESDNGSLMREAKLTSAQEQTFAEQLQVARTYMALREAGKHYMMRGYALLRDTLMELGRRSGLAGDIFYLLPDELPRLVTGEDLSTVARTRRRERKILLSIEVPMVLFSDDLQAIGRPLPVAAGDELQGTPVSAGTFEGTALVLDEPISTSQAGFVLVCPSTDPAWVPLFLHAKALIMETGGILSHGAIVAREFGLPAVVGIPGVQRRIKTGQRVRVDGNTGRVHVFDEG